VSGKLAILLHLTDYFTLLGRHQIAGITMNNNDILRRLRYVFDLPDVKIVNLFASVGAEVDRDKVSRWLKKDDDPWFTSCSDEQLATFLNGFIVSRRGKREGPQPKAEKKLNNNLILRKLKIALNLQSHDIISTLDAAGLSISEHELSAFFRKPGHQHYRECKDQVLRNFLEGLRLKYRTNG
jgi:uncharacterized protein YehS (DUF1456 family)